MIKRLLKIHKGESGLGGVLLAILIALLIGGGIGGILGYIYFDRDTSMPDTPVIPGDVEWKNFGCNEEDGGNQFEGDWGVVVCMPYSLKLVEFDYRLGRAAGGTMEFTIEVYEWADDDGKGDFVGRSDAIDIDDIEESAGYPAVQPWNTFEFTDDVYLTKDVWYTIYLHADGGTGDAYIMTQDGVDCIGAVTKGYFYGTDWSNSADMDYWITGTRQIEPEVVTVGHVIETDGSISMEGWCEVVGRLEVGFIVSNDEEGVNGGVGTDYECGKTGWSAARHYFAYRLVYVENELQYFYRAYAGVPGGERWYGVVKSFTRYAGDVPVSLWCDVIENSIDEVEFSTRMMGCHEGVTYNLSIAYGTTMEGMRSLSDTIAVQAVVEGDGSWRTVSRSGEDFEAGERYFYRAVSDGDDDSMNYSRTATFTCYDPGQPGFMNWLGWLFNMDIGTLWWLVALAGMASVWVLAGLLGWWPLGVVGTFIMLLLLVAAGMVSPWLIVLLTLIAGWIIFKLVFKKAGARG